MPYSSNGFALYIVDCNINTTDLNFTQWINSIKDDYNNDYGSPNYNSDINKAKTGRDTSSTMTSAMLTSSSLANSENETSRPSPLLTNNPNNTNPKAED
jgi:hypothetical protein